MKPFCFAAVSSIVLLSIFAADSSMATAGVLGVCIQNCGQCEKMYGEFFHGQECAEHCLRTFGVSTPDCSKINSIQRYLGPSAKLLSAAQTRLEQQIPRFLVKTRVEKDTHGLRQSTCKL